MIKRNLNGFLLPLSSYSSNSQKLEPIYFQFNPQITDRKGANFDTVDILGRAEPVQIYKSSSERNIGMTLVYAAYSYEHDPRWVAKQIARLRALVYPIYKRSGVNAFNFSAPPLVLLNYGIRYVNIPCVVKDVSVNEEEEVPIDITTRLAHATRVELSLSVSYAYGSVPGHDDVAMMYTGKDDDARGMYAGTSYENGAISIDPYDYGNTQNNQDFEIYSGWGGWYDRDGVNTISMPSTMPTDYPSSVGQINTFMNQSGGAASNDLVPRLTTVTQRSVSFSSYKEKGPEEKIVDSSGYNNIIFTKF